MAEVTWSLAPGEKLDFKFDWDAYLSETEIISSYEVTAQTGVTISKDQLADSNRSVVVWLDGSAVEENHDYKITCKVVTSEDRTAIRYKVVKAHEKGEA